MTSLNARNSVKFPRSGERFFLETCSNTHANPLGRMKKVKKWGRVGRREKHKYRTRLDRPSAPTLNSEGKEAAPDRLLQKDGLDSTVLE